MRLSILQKSSPLARWSLIACAALVIYFTYTTWDSPAPQPISLPDLADPIVQLQYAVAVLSLIVAGLAGALRRAPRQLPLVTLLVPAVRVRLKPAARFAIFKRDGYRCQLCGQSAHAGARLEVDHKLAVANGGTNDPANLWTLCQVCNNGKSDSIL